MESLNSYISDGESDSSTNMEDTKKFYSKQEEADANCEPITMDMSEDSCSGQSDSDKKNQPTKRYYSKSLSPSPPTSYSSESSPERRKKRSDDERGRISPDRSRDPVKSRRFDDDRKKRSRDYKRDNDSDKRYSADKIKDGYRDKDSDRYQSRRYDSKRSQRSRSRSRSRSYTRHSGSKHKPKSRSRSRSRDRYRRNSPRRSNKRRSPYRTRRSRTPSPAKEKSRSYDWKSSSKLKVLEKLGIELKVPPSSVDSQPITQSVPSNSQLTPQLLLQKTMEQQVEKVKTATGIELPSYYNPIAVNPTKYAEQIQKRRLLWGNKQPKPEVKEQPVAKPVEAKSSGTIWQGATFGGDQDGKMTAKFKRLMGIKNPEKDGNPKLTGSDLIKKQEEMFHSMESQYEVARLATHSHRGLGLGFGTFQPR